MYEHDHSHQVRQEVLAGDSLNLACAMRLLAGGGAPPSTVTAWRWVTKGLSLACGRRVRLEATRFGKRWLTSRAALGRFAAAQQGDVPTHRTPPAAPPAGPGRRGRPDAVTRLDDAGI
jgi:hypothetical protein